MQFLTGLANTLPWFAWVAIVGIVSGAAQAIVQSLITHRERMAMISQGMYPDAEATELIEDPTPTPRKSPLHEL